MASATPPPGATSGATVVDPDADANAAAALKRAEELRDAEEERDSVAKAARDAALARAADADREAAIAQQERDAADARVRAAQEPTAPSPSFPWSPTSSPTWFAPGSSAP